MKQAKNFVLPCFLYWLLTMAAYAQVPLPTAIQVGWQQAEMGVVFHYDLHVFDGKKYNQNKNRLEPVPDYNIFNPAQLNTDQWIKAAKDGGATFAVLTVTHETGFALYQSDVNPYCMKALKWQNGQGDILRDFVNSCRKYGIMPGVYIGIRWNAYLGVHDFKIEGNNPLEKNRQQAYKKMCEGMVEEITTRYGNLFMVWFDGGASDPKTYGADVLPIVEKNQPHCLFYHNAQRADFRWGGSETGTVSYPCWANFPFPYSHADNTDFIFKDNFRLLKEGDENGKYYMPAMSDAPLRGYNNRHEWFWEPGDEEHIYPVQHLVNMYCRSVGHNSTLILGLTPNPAGLLDQQDVDTLAAFGEKIKALFENPVDIVRNSNHESIALTIPKNKKVQHIVIQENIVEGQKIREFEIMAREHKKWKTIFTGSSVGHKFIYKLPHTSRYKNIKLVIKKSIGTPAVKLFAAY
ncbi:MAG: alpha-L-fucosidase [Agriterribacter sp.]